MKRTLISILFGLIVAGLWGAYHIARIKDRRLGSKVGVFAAAPGGEASFFKDDGEAPTSGKYRLSALSVFSNVALHIKDNYVEPERIKPKEMLLSALQEVERQIAEVLVEDLGDGRVRIQVVDKEKLLDVDDVESLWEINLKLREAFRFLEKHIPPQKDMRNIEYAAVNGALSTLDPHSILLKPEAFAEMKTSTKGEFGGLGIVISVRDGKLTIISPLDGTPASRAGLRAGDIIARIGDVSTVSMPIEEAVTMLRGKEGSKVTIWVDRKDWAESKAFKITRERIKIRSVESHLLTNNIGYIQIKNFQQNTARDLSDNLAKLKDKAGRKLDGVVLDLRNNPGGLLDQAIKVSDKFVTKGDIVTTVGYGDKLREPKRARWAGTEDDLPIAVLVNKGSASASEIVAGALKNLGRAVVIGEKTFGKGSVQVLYDFADNSALKLTIAQYLTPGNISIQNEGVTPDIALKPAWVEKDGVRLFYEPEGHREKNLEKHLERTEQAQAGKASQSFFNMDFLVEPEKDKKKLGDKFKEDYPIKFAREFLKGLGANSSKEMLSASRKFLENKKTTEDARIRKKIQDLKVDWTKPETLAAKGTASDENVRVSLSLSGGHKEIETGKEVELNALVTNNGATPIYNLHGTIDSEHFAFKGREFLFGKVGPNETRKWVVKTKVPKDVASRSDVLTLNLASAKGKLKDNATLALTTKFAAKPQFGYSFAFDDSKRGDGDGVLEQGEGVEFMIFVTNTGKGVADEVTLRLRSGAKKNLFLERGRVNIGKIGAGETQVGTLKFRVKKVPADEALPLELTIYDTGSGEWLEDEFRVFAEAKQKTATRKSQKGVTTKRETPVFAAAGGQHPLVLATLRKGARLRTDRTSGDHIRVELKKEAYGWVRVEDTKKSRRPKTLPKNRRLIFRPARQAPTIELAGSPGGRVVQSSSMQLSGQVVGRKLRDMYVLVNDEKVFFRQGPRDKVPGTDDSLSVPNEQAAKLPFSVNLKLKDGLNKILVVARLDERVMSYKSLYISKRAAKNKPVVSTGPVTAD